MLKQILLVGLGGGIGSIFRFLVSHFTVKAENDTFPLATFAVNIAGCLLIGLLAGLVLRQNWPGACMRMLLMTGFCGGFTTFSTFSLENVQMCQAGHYLSLVLYVLASVVFGVAATGIGLLITK